MTPRETGSPTAVDDFWNLAKFHAKLNHMPGYFGPTALESVMPPAWSFGDTAQESDQALAALLDGSGTTTTTARAEYDAAGEPLPEVGSLGIVLDGRGHPRALVSTVAVDLVAGDVVEHFSVLYSAQPQG